jgi:hypothetical protein
MSKEFSGLVSKARKQAKKVGITKKLLEAII